MTYSEIGLSTNAFLFGLAFIGVCTLITLIVIRIGSKKNK